MKYPSPDTLHPVRLPDGTAVTQNVFLQAALEHPRISVGAYSYASDSNPTDTPDGWAARLAPYLYANAADRLVIGRFVQIAEGVRFITHGANHLMSGFSTYPFAIHDPDRLLTYHQEFPRGRDTVVGHDVWIGRDACVLAGAQIGRGAIIGAGSVVAGDIPDYSVVVGNPGRIIRLRFPEDVISRLMQLAWWDWPIEKIIGHEALITGADIDALEAV
ncbi:CatB-related O-acetyltransferase [uncultured Roseobacter sp.]|uniref:CatB-related O-acetyltransferase n=1 Tax=uncultured Roseobacter sp. TaxID=114847 RepID=UPI002631F2E4|nr:CatB-related O-acetyltransferase [uncultured Roseobacter sp.]